MDFGAEEVPELVSPDDDSFARGAALDDLNIRVRSRAFRGGTLTVVMCGVTIDLREAALSPDGATISVQSALSEIDLLVPRDWDVVYNVEGIFGGIDSDRFRAPSGADDPRLRVTGLVVGGDLCVR